MRIAFDLLNLKSYFFRLLRDRLSHPFYPFWRIYSLEFSVEELGLVKFRSKDHFLQMGHHRSLEDSSGFAESYFTAQLFLARTALSHLPLLKYWR